jgi:parvulin-like peptidyl-prolyl isomerase
MKKIVSLLFLFLFISACSQNSQTVGYINGEKVSEDRFKSILIENYGFDMKDMERQYQSDLPAEETRKAIRNELKQIFKEFYTAYAFYQEGQKQNFFKSPDLQKKVDDVKKQIASRYIGQKIWEQEIKPLVPIEQTRRITNEDYSIYTKQLKVKHILISSNQSQRKIKNKVRLIKNALENNRDFSQLAAKYSDDPGTKNNGGNLGWVDYASPLVPAFKEALFLNQNAPMIGPVETKYGFHFIKVEDSRTIPLEKVQKNPEITKQIQKWKESMVKKLSFKAVHKYMETLEAKYRDRIFLNPKLIHISLLQLAGYLRKNHPRAYFQMTRAIARTFSSAKPEHLGQMVLFLWAKKTDIWNDWKKQNQDIFYKLEGVGSVTVPQILEAFEDKLPVLLKNPEQMEKEIISSVIHHDLRYLEGMKKGYEKDEILKKQIEFSTIHFMGIEYEQHLMKEHKEKVEAEMDKKTLRSFYKDNPALFREPIPQKISKRQFEKLISRSGEDQKKALQNAYFLKENNYVLMEVSAVTRNKAWEILEKRGMIKLPPFRKIKDQVEKEYFSHKEEQYKEALETKIRNKYGISVQGIQPQVVNPGA